MVLDALLTVDGSGCQSGVWFATWICAQLSQSYRMVGSGFLVPCAVINRPHGCPSPVAAGDFEAGRDTEHAGRSKTSTGAPRSGVLARTQQPQQRRNVVTMMCVNHRRTMHIGGHRMSTKLAQN